MLDLIGLTLSTMDERWTSGQDVTDAILHGHCRGASVGQTVSVVIVPSVTQTYLGYIDNKTNFYKVSPSRLSNKLLLITSKYWSDISWKWFSSKIIGFVIKCDVPSGLDHHKHVTDEAYL